MTTYLPNANPNLACLSVFADAYEMIPIVGWRMDPSKSSTQGYEVVAAPVTIDVLSEGWAIYDTASGRVLSESLGVWETLDAAVTAIRAELKP